MLTHKLRILLRPVDYCHHPAFYTVFVVAFHVVYFGSRAGFLDVVKECVGMLYIVFVAVLPLMYVAQNMIFARKPPQST